MKVLQEELKMEICISSEGSRRPIKARSLPIFEKIARLLLGIGVSPNQVSLSSIAFAFIAAGALAYTPLCGGFDRTALFICAAFAIQLRLICNLLDGLMAIEGGFATKIGAVLNEMPDRFSDYAANKGMLGIELGWAAALIAMSTAYIRVFGGSLGLKQDFRGPLAKQQRMFALTCACVLSAFSSSISWSQNILTVTLVVVCFGGLITCVRRLVKILDELSYASVKR
jgi:phosphatidylglycerophosphate synthase